MSSPYTSTVANTASSGGAISDAVLEALRGTKGWVKLVGVLLYICAVFVVIATVGMMFGLGLSGVGKGAIPFAGMAFIALIYAAMAAVYGFLGQYLIRYSGAINRLIADGQLVNLEEALQCQRKFWRLAGVVALISIVLAVLGIVAAIAIPIFAGR